MTEPTTPVPLLRIVRGNPTAEELAAVVVAITAKAAGTGVPAAGPRSAWGTYWNARRAPLAAGVGGWRASALPRG